MSDERKGLQAVVPYAEYLEISRAQDAACRDRFMRVQDPLALDARWERSKYDGSWRIVTQEEMDAEAALKDAMGC